MVLVEILFSLLQKNKLPNIQQIISAGGVRNLLISNDDITSKNTIVAQVSGLNENEAITSVNYLNFDSTIFYRLDKQNIAYSLIYDNRANQTPLLFFKDFPTSNIIINEQPYSYTSAFNTLIDVVKERSLVENKSLLTFVNMSEPLLIARQSREGGNSTLRAYNALIVH